MKLVDTAKVIRSKNAGPVTLSFDIMFDRQEDYERACRAPGLAPAAIARLYGADPQRVRVYPYPVALAIKIAIDRPTPAGAPGDRDVYGAQQHGPLLEVEL